MLGFRWYDDTDQWNDAHNSLIVQIYFVAKLIFLLIFIYFMPNRVAIDDYTNGWWIILLNNSVVLKGYQIIEKMVVSDKRMIPANT
jgi:general stress protein CsbA